MTEAPQTIRDAVRRGDVDGYALFVRWLCEQQKIAIVWIEAFDIPRASAETRNIYIRPICDDERFAVALHEAAHVILGPCPGTEPHRPQRVENNKYINCICCETEATRLALRLAPRLTPAMHQKLASGLRSYRWTPAGRPAIDRLEVLASFSGFASAKQDLVAKDLFADRKRLVSQWQSEINSDPSSIAALRKRLETLTR